MMMIMDFWPPPSTYTHTITPNPNPPTPILSHTRTIPPVYPPTHPFIWFNDFFLPWAGCFFGFMQWFAKNLSYFCCWRVMLAQKRPVFPESAPCCLLSPLSSFTHRLYPLLARQRPAQLCRVTDVPRVFFSRELWNSLCSPIGGSSLTDKQRPDSFFRIQSPLQFATP